MAGRVAAHRIEKSSNPHLHDMRTRGLRDIILAAYSDQELRCEYEKVAQFQREKAEILYTPCPAQPLIQPSSTQSQQLSDLAKGLGLANKSYRRKIRARPANTVQLQKFNELMESLGLLPAGMSAKSLEEEVDADEVELECPICMEGMDETQVSAQLPCGHWFHGKCVHSWFQESDTCPMCRHQLSIGEIEAVIDSI